MPHAALSYPPAHADGKAGSLIDDRGHFYKPLQRGPRGDRERAFYAAIAEMLQAEATAQAAVAAGARSQDSAHHGDKRAAGSADGGSPTVCLNGDSASASPLSPWQGALRGGDGSPAVKLPWKSAKQLMELFPSFKAFQRERAPMEVMQVGAACLLLPGPVQLAGGCCLPAAPGLCAAGRWVLLA